MGHSPKLAIPVVDLDEEIRLASGQNTNSWISKSHAVRRAMEEYGCFIVKYDSICPDTAIMMEKELKELFDLPLETKKKNHFDTEPLRGYVGNISTLPLYEATGIDKPTLEGIQEFANLMWPDQEKSTFCESVHSLSTVMKNITLLVIQMVFGSYDLLKYYASCVEQMEPRVRVARYMVPDSMSETNSLGLLPHLDTDFVTVLYQNNTNGIEIQSEGGEWISVDLSPSSFLFMAGEGLMAWSNGRIQAANHKVSMANNTKIRYSFGMFTYKNGLTKTPEELVDEKHPLKFKPFIHEDYMRAYYAHRGPNKGIYTLSTHCGIN